MAQLAARFGFGRHLGHLTSSGTIANLEALFVARQTHPGKAIAYSADAHYTHSRMCHLLGVDGVPVATAADGTTLRLLPLTPDGLGAALRPGRRAALAWAERIKSGDRLSLYQDPQLDILTWVTSVTIDCADPQRLARFWADLLGLRVRPRESRYVALTRPATGTPELVFQPVPEEKIGKVRLHLDIGVHDLDRARRRAVELGASHADDLDDRDDDSLVVMRDPEGNEFCLIHRKAGDL